MAKQIIVQITCDNHDEADVEAQTHTVALDGEGPVEIDLCDPCATQLLDPLRAIVAVHGQPIPAPVKRTKRAATEAPTPSTADRLCPTCGALLGNRNKLRTHMQEQHDQLIDGTPRAEAPARCDTCGGGFTDNRGLSAHQRANGHLPAAAKPTKARKARQEALA